MAASRPHTRLAGTGLSNTAMSTTGGSTITKPSFRELVKKDKIVHAVEVADPALLDELLDGIVEEKTEKKDGRGSQLDHNTLVQSQMEALEAHKRETMRLSTQAYEEKMQKMRQAQERAREEQQRKAEADFQKKMEEFEKEKEYAERVQRTVDAYHASRSRKAEQLYREWEDEVYYNIQSQIQEQMSGDQWKKSWDAKKVAYDAYLRESTGKQVFNDTVDTANYDPFGPQKQRVKYRLKNIKDPVKRDMNKKWDEDALVGAGTRPQQIKGRTALDVTQWAHLDSTPYTDRIEDDGKPKKPPPPMARSNIVIDHYTQPDPSTVIAEFPKGKRIHVGKLTATTELKKDKAGGKKMVPENRFSQGKETTHLEPQNRGKRVFAQNKTALY